MDSNDLPAGAARTHPALTTRKQLSLLPDVDRIPLRTSLLPEPARRIYCNRGLRMDQIDWVGFDMDYTLAQYRQDQMDRLTIQAALDKLIAQGFPESLRGLDPTPRFPIRGLVIDAKLGNVLKMDRHKYVKRAYHGLRELSYDERRTHYRATRVQPRDRKRYHFIDTLYALSEVTLFAAGVEHMEREGMAVDYARWFHAIRECVDRSHQDGSILDEITQHPASYLVLDPELPLTLHKLRSAGKRLFLLTNSQPDYTDRIMAHVFERLPAQYRSWKQLFDVVIAAAQKPGFFHGEEPVKDRRGRPVERLRRGTIYVGGSALALERLTSIGGDRVLYVGDHIYGDVLRAKKHSPWRTAMIIPELDDELFGVTKTAPEAARWDQLEEARGALLDELRALRQALRHGRLAPLSPPISEAEAHARALRFTRRMERTKAQLRAIESESAELEQSIESEFHPFWGPLLKAGAEPSSFGHQVKTYACLYTMRVSNFLGYSSLHYFRPPRERLPHEG